MALGISRRDSTEPGQQDCLQGTSWLASQTSWHQHRSCPLLSAIVSMCWSEVVKDYIAFCADDTVLSKIPSDFVPYFLHELSLLFPDNGTQLSVNTLKRVHAAKTTGAEVKDKYDEESTESRAQRRE